MRENRVIFALIGAILLIAAIGAPLLIPTEQKGHAFEGCIWYPDGRGFWTRVCR